MPCPVSVLISVLQGGGTPGLLERQGYIVLDGEDEVRKGAKYGILYRLRELPLLLNAFSKE